MAHSHDSDRSRSTQQSRYSGPGRTYFEEVRATLGERIGAFGAVALRLYPEAASPEHAIDLHWARTEPSSRSPASDHVVNWSRAERVAETLLRSVDCLLWLERAIDAVHHEIIDNVRAGWRCPTAIHPDTHKRFTLDPFLLEIEGLDRVENLIRSSPHTLLDLRFFDPQPAPDSVTPQPDPATQPLSADFATPRPADFATPRSPGRGPYDVCIEEYLTLADARGVGVGRRTTRTIRLTWKELVDECREHCQVPASAKVVGISETRLRERIESRYPGMLS